MAATNHATSNSAGATGGVALLTSNPIGHLPNSTHGDQLRLQKQLDSVLKSIKGPAVQEAVRSIFTDLARLCDALRIVEINASEGGPLPVTLALFSLVESESKSLIRFIERRIPKIKSIKGPLRQVLDGTSFALRHELKRVFGHELIGISRELKTNKVRADVMRAHGLLSNCFQQSIIALAQVFKPSISAENLFEDYRDRLEQSTMLLRDISSLMELARVAAETRDDEANDLLIRDLRAFCHGSMHYLMYKDWDEFDDIAREVMTSHGSARHGFLLHCFATYLEALINQVQMRAVLHDQPTGLREERPLKSA
jgi:hypothetical protein